MNVPRGASEPSRIALITPDIKAKNIAKYKTEAINTILEALKINDSNSKYCP